MALMLAEQLVGEARERRRRRMDARERTVDGASAAAFLLVALVLALALPVERHPDLALVAGLVVGYAIVSRVRFEFGEAYVSPEELVFLPILLLAPLPYVPVLVATAALASTLPDLSSGNWHHHRWITPISDSWFSIGPVLVLAALGSGTPTVVDAPLYAAAFGAQLAGDCGWAFIRNRLLNPIPFRELCTNYLATARVAAVLSSIGFVIGLVGAQEPLALLTIGPLVWLLDVFARDRQERYAAALELHRAYRGTVMLLSDVVEFEDPYTAHHSRSVVDLVQGIAEELGVPQGDRQELEFAALLHDVGKIAIPKEILNKPAKLTEQEFEIVKTHTIEGQFMLDRVGGLLGRVGEIVRSCHERWDGNGYPDGLAGEEIPVAARVVFACDAYSAMTTDRVYRPAMSTDAALDELRVNAGTQFDPDVVSALTKVVEDGEPVIAPVESVRALLAGMKVPQRLGAAS